MLGRTRLNHVHYHVHFCQHRKLGAHHRTLFVAVSHFLLLVLAARLPEV